MEELSTKMENDPSIKFGRFLTHPLPGEEIVISGISGKFPESRDIHHFRDNLYNKVDMVSADYRRWRSVHPKIPPRSGKLLDIKKFDNGFFGIDRKQADDTEPMLRMLLELVAEAMFDAGYQPSDFENSKAGVYLGCCMFETEPQLAMDPKPGTKMMTGALKTWSTNRISYFYKLNGPSYITDTACSSSLVALEEAYIAIRTGKCDKAIVCGSNLCLHPYVSLKFVGLGEVLSKEGLSRTFDIDGDGYVRSEAVCVILLEKAKDAKRIYANVVHCKSNANGFIEEGITYPSAKAQTKLLRELYTECKVDCKDISYFEAHGTGTIAGDPQECRGIDTLFTKGRKTPLLIGSVKSNIGHTEGAAGVASIVKVILAYETGYIAPNLHFKTPRPNISSIVEGRMKVVTEKTPLPNEKGLIGVSSFGFGGSNSHVLLKWNEKKKVVMEKDSIPRLICVSGRTLEAIDTLLDDVIENHLDPEHIRLLQNGFRKNVAGHLYRGYSLVTKEEVEIKRSSCIYKCKRNQLYLAFGAPNSSLLNLGKQLKTLSTFNSYLKEVQNQIADKHVRIGNLQSLSESLATVIIQLGILHTFKELEISPDRVFGQSTGLIVSAYHDGVLTLKQALLCGYLLGQSVNGHGAPANKKQLAENLLKVIKTPNNKTDSNDEKKLLHAMLNYETNAIKNHVTSQSVILEFGHVANMVRNKKTEILSCNVEEDAINNFFLCIGRLYQLGHDVQLHKIYPKIEFPVSRGTPMISPKIRWRYGKDAWAFNYNVVYTDQTKEQITFRILVTDEVWLYLSGHIIDGRNLFPATGYLYLVWDVVARMKGKLREDLCVRFENIKFRKSANIPSPKDHYHLQLIVTVQRGNNNFEIVESDVALVTGTVNVLESDKCSMPNISQMPNVGEEKDHIMRTKDIYKELRLRGYNYKDYFKCVTEITVDRTYGKIAWHENFVAFMDNMLQTLILKEDTRRLYVPTSIQSVTVNGPAHLHFISQLTKQQNPNDEEGFVTQVPFNVSAECNLVRSGFIEIAGLDATWISRKKSFRLPILEKYQFVPNETKLLLHEAVRVNLQIILENSWNLKNKVVELIDDATISKLPLTVLVRDVFDDQPLVQSELKILSKQNIQGDINDIVVEDGLLNSETNCTIVIGTNLLGRETVLDSAFNSLTVSGYVMSRQSLDFDVNTLDADKHTIFTVFLTPDEKIVLLGKRSKTIVTPTIVNLSMKNTPFDWLLRLQQVIKNSSNVVVYAQNEPLNGIMGFVNCIRKESGGDKVKCVFILGDAPTFDINNEFYIMQLDKNMAVNILKDGLWGTYRHLRLGELPKEEREDSCVMCTVKGDISSLRWVESPLSNISEVDPECDVIGVYYCSLNFKDIMMASGKITMDSVTKNRKFQEYGEGYEFSGRHIKSGKRVMGLTPQGALSTYVEGDRYLLWDVPDHWTLEDASTVPMVYMTSLYSLHQIGRIKAKDSILIHSGTGGIGQAAINVCLHMGCDVFVTVGTEGKREFIRKHYPQIPESHIGCSRDVNFEHMVKKYTNGKGVDFVLNSLAEDKLLSSVRCLAAGGRFLEIGKYDLVQNNRLNLSLFHEKGASYHGLMLDKMAWEVPPLKNIILELVRKGIESGAVKPLVRQVFQSDEVEQAYRFMGTGKHIGKVMIKIREEEENVKLCTPSIVKFMSTPRFLCNNIKTYVICGGLGGFGLELADWLILRGATKLVLTSRNGITNGYQSYRIRIWKSYGCIVKISTQDITTKMGCEALIKEANELGPIDAIFNLAVILQDAIFENQTPESFSTSFGPKAYATEYLDELTRQLCPEMRYFVVFSSVSCGRGNAGQTNYGMANSVMERICEKRQHEGYPAIAIQWGAIGDVGLVAEAQKDDQSEVEIGGTLQQSIVNCLQVIDTLLRQEESCIVSSVVVAEKRNINASASLVESVARILGIRDVKSISMQSTLAESGMDSMNAVEVKQTLEREFDVMLTSEEIRSMTFAKIKSLQDIAELKNEKVKDQEKFNGVSVDLKMLVRYLGDEETSNIAIQHLSSRDISANESTRPKIIMLPGLIGIATDLIPLANNLSTDVVSLQYCNQIQEDTVEKSAHVLLPYILENMSSSGHFHIVCHSYGCLIGLEVVKQLEHLGHTGTVTFIDGAPSLLKSIQILSTENDEDIINSLILQALSLLVPINVISVNAQTIMNSKSLDDKITISQNIISSETTYSKNFLKETLLGTFKRIKALRDYQPEFAAKIISPVTLIKPLIPSAYGLKQDYGLSEFCSKVNVQNFEGNHVTVLENVKVAEAIMRFINAEVES